MPQLDLAASREFWKNYPDPMILRVLAFMESVEDFTCDGDPALEAVMTQLGEALDKLTGYELGKEEQFVGLCAHLKSSRILRLLQTIDSIEPGSASRMLMYAEENNRPDNFMVGLFLRRNIIFERLRLLARVFSTERMKLVLDVLEGHV